MAGLAQAFDIDKVEDDDVLPAGDYPVRIIVCEEFENKKGTGRILKLTLRVDDGRYKGRLHWERLNYVHKNPTAQNIAQQSLKKICKATGAPQPLTDSSELHNRPFIATLKVIEDDYGKKNELKGSKPYGNGAQPAQATAAPAQSSPSAATPNAEGGTPWD